MTDLITSLFFAKYKAESASQITCSWFKPDADIAPLKLTLMNNFSFTFSINTSTHTELNLKICQARHVLLYIALITKDITQPYHEQEA